MKIIYHGNCQDGFTAAWALRQKYTGAEFVAGVYQTPPPDCTDEDVILVDFSYKLGVMLGILEQAKSVLVLDHHASAIADLDPLIGQPKFHAVFDTSRSGCRIAWDWAVPHMKCPQFLLHVEDRDLWKFKLPNTRPIVAAMFSYEYDFDILDDWYNRGGDALQQLLIEGTAIERKHFKDIAEMLKVTRRAAYIGGHYVPVANLPYIYSSDAGHMMCESEPFAACYWDTPTGRTFSLRSNQFGVDVSKIAAMYGGGGHVNAAGFSIKWDDHKMPDLG